MIDFGMNVQAAGDAARVRHFGSATPTGNRADGAGTVDVTDHETLTLSISPGIVSESGGEFLPVFLECSLDELRRRVVAPSRREMRKLHSVEGLEGWILCRCAWLDAELEEWAR